MDQSNTPDRGEQVKPGQHGARTEREALARSDSPAALPPQPVSARAWLSQNGPWLLFFAAGIAFVYTRFGADVLFSAFVALVGLGFVIFIHELGHFLAAKWCDVHVLTFSIGFGPAVPGCSFTRGETTYKLALLPLGGYVNMVGEGPEADEDEDYPRSFKNKTVGQRMLIISAGVVMNVLFGALCFVVVYLYYGVERAPAIVWRTEPGSRSWEAGVQAGWKIRQIDDKKDPYFDEMRALVALSPEGRTLRFTFQDRQGKDHEIDLEPFRDVNNMHPVIGVAQAYDMQLIPKRYQKLFGQPYAANSAASYAREIPLRLGEVPVKATDPRQGGALTELPEGEAGWLELCQRMTVAGKEPFTVEVRSTTEPGKTRRVEASTRGFQFGDVILATTNPATPGEPFNLLALPADPNGDSRRNLPDPFVFRTRMTELAGKPIVLQVRPEEGGEPVNLLVPPAYHRRIGVRMKMGKVAALRQGENAPDWQKIGLRAGAVDGDVITGVKLQWEDLPPLALEEAALDPVRLPTELSRRVQESGKDPWKYRVILTVRGTVGHDANAERTLPPIPWNPEFTNAGEAPVSPSAPTSIPQLGIAYWIESTVLKVEPGSPADRAGVKPGDVIQEISYRERGRKLGQVTWGSWYKMASQRGKDQEVYDQWAHYFFILQRTDYPIIRVKVKRVTDGKQPEIVTLPAVGGEIDAPDGVTRVSRWLGMRNPDSQENPVEQGIEAEPDLSWPLAERGLLFEPDTRLHKARSFMEAFTLGMERTVGFIQQIYMNLSRLLSGRISAKSLGGPIEIGAQAISAAGDSVSVFALFLGMISINLAVVNFLPIPVLDGGHMVFLIYEKLRGKPPSEAIRIAATYLGLAMILGLMIFVFVLDIRRRFL